LKLAAGLPVDGESDSAAQRQPAAGAANPPAGLYMLAVTDSTAIMAAV